MGGKIAIWKSSCPDCGSPIVEVERSGDDDRAKCSHGHWSAVLWHSTAVGDLEPELRIEGSTSQRAA